MRKVFFVLVVFMTTFSNVFSQNEIDIQNDIRKSLNDFMARLSDLNADEEDRIKISTISSEFGGGNYFKANGIETTIDDFLQKYKTKDLKLDDISHLDLDFNRNSIKKMSNDPVDQSWSVKATMFRENKTGEDYLIKKEPITFVVRWNGTDKQVSLLEINFSTTLNKVYPQTTREYLLEIGDKYPKSFDSYNTINMPYTGGDWNISIKSWWRDVKRYSGMEDKTEYGNYYYAPFTYEVNPKMNIEEKDVPQILSGKLRANFSKYPKNYNIKIIQPLSGKSITQKITQQKKKNRTFFDYDSDEYFQIDVNYSLKYDLGLSFMYTFDYSRFALGALIETNFNTFRGIENPFDKVDQLNIPSSTSANESFVQNGYNVVKTKEIEPNASRYSKLLDPYNEAKTYTQRSLFMAQGGVCVNNWLRFDLGLGAALARNIYYMGNAYKLEVYSYEKKEASLPEIEDVYVYKSKYKDYYYKDATKWGFAFRPALNFQIPLDSYDEQFITLGCGYTFVTNLNNANSFDFSIGFRWTN